jgi:formylmethanofuran dehydrogenase subunit C
VTVPAAAFDLRLRALPRFRVDLTGVTPLALAALGEAEAGRVAVRHGNEAVALGELFEIRRRPASAPALYFEGDLSRFDRLAWEMEDGEIRVDGPVGHYAAARLRGGLLAVGGDAGGFAACEMAGGVLVVAGSVGDFAAAALPGSMDGMRGGTLVVRGDAGARFADRMRRGTAFVFGDAGDFFASRLVAGTIALGGRCGAHPGWGMRRGTLVFAGEAPAVPATFVESGHDLRVFWTLLARDLARAGGPFAVLPGRRVRRFAGDIAVDGKGEWLLPE